MSSPVWTTPRNLGIAEENSYLEFQFAATSDTPSMSYSFVSGNLATGLTVTHTGLLVGVPVALKDNDYTSEFTIRATDNYGQITDRKFQLLVSAVEPPTITTSVYRIGTYNDGTMISYQLEARDDNPVGELNWRIVHGTLPPGVTLTSNGLINGYLYKNHNSPIGYNIGWDNTIWDKENFDDLNEQNPYTDYQFTVEVSDGIQQNRKSFVIRVISQDALPIDNPAAHMPFINNVNGPLTQIRTGLARERSNFAFKFNATDIDGDPVNYSITSPDDLGFDQDGDVGFDSDEFDGSAYPMPVQMGLDNTTGWYSGQLFKQKLHEKNYQFQVYANKLLMPGTSGHRSTINLRVLGTYNQTIQWITDSDLGTITDGAVSGLSVRAISTVGAQLIYKIKSNPASRTPQGIILLSDGMLSGRASFKHLSIDSTDTSFDNHTTTIDELYKFTVIAESADGAVYTEKTFTLKVLRNNVYPYENLYLRGFPNGGQRTLFKSIIDSEHLFPTELIYRPTDPWFGKAQDLRFLFLSGLNAVDIENYYQAVSKNHYNKKVLMGDIKLAYALDDLYRVVYEVVYIDVIDELEGHDPVTGEPTNCPQTINVTDRKNYYRDKGVTYTQLTPNGLGNMRKQIISTIGISNSNTLPQWMTCLQPDPASPGKYLPPIGYKPAVILAYTVPGAGQLITYRLTQSKFNFNRIEFSTDRYVLDDYLSSNYDPVANEFVPASETLFDTTFDSTGTRFFNHVDHYAGPEQYAKYIKFTKFGEFV